MLQDPASVCTFFLQNRRVPSRVPSRPCVSQHCLIMMMLLTGTVHMDPGVQPLTRKFSCKPDNICVQARRFSCRLNRERNARSYDKCGKMHLRWEFGGRCRPATKRLRPLATFWAHPFQQPVAVGIRTPPCAFYNNLWNPAPPPFWTRKFNHLTFLGSVGCPKPESVTARHSAVSRFQSPSLPPPFLPFLLPPSLPPSWWHKYYAFYHSAICA